MDGTTSAGTTGNSGMLSALLRNIDMRALLHRVIDEIASEQEGRAAGPTARPLGSCLALPENLPLALLPELARDLVRVIGFHPTMALVSAKGGQCILVPKGERRRGVAFMDELAEIVGAEAAAALCHTYGGGYLTIPNCKKALGEVRRDYARLRFDALTTGANPIGARAAVNLLATEFGVSQSTLWEWNRTASKVK